jgi:hypothetical protein
VDLYIHSPIRLHDVVLKLVKHSDILPLDVRLCSQGVTTTEVAVTKFDFNFIIIVYKIV